MQISVLTNDKAEKGFYSEHGLSLFIEQDNRKILFDTGWTDIFLKNAEKLNIDISQIDVLVLSHRHYDHAGGLEYFCNKNKNALIYASPSIVKPNYSFKNGKWIYKGMSYKILYSRWIRIIRKQRLSENVYLLSSIKRYIPKFAMEDKFREQIDKKHFAGFNEETVLLVKIQQGWILISGCSHAGIYNIVRDVIESGFTPIYAILGGLHLVSAKESILQNIIDYLKENVQYIYPMHCTGEKAEKAFLNDMPNRVFPLIAGNKVVMGG